MEARINKMINYKKMLWSFMEFSQLNFQRIYEHQLTLLLDIGAKGLNEKPWNRILWVITDFATEK